MPNEKHTLILVDLDGTLFDTVAVNAASYRAALEEVGATVTDEYYARYCNGGYYKSFLRPLLGGDPPPELVEQVHDRKKALYAVCLGHQLTALAAGARTTKLKYGHRGANQPVKNLSNDRIFVSSQNHGYAVDTNALPSNGIMSYENANDGTCEGIRYLDIPAFTVQFHPEACGGPHDTNFLFDEFVEMIDSHRA